MYVRINQVTVPPLNILEQGITLTIQNNKGSCEARITSVDGATRWSRHYQTVGLREAKDMADAMFLALYFNHGKTMVVGEKIRLVKIIRNYCQVEPVLPASNEDI